MTNRAGGEDMYIYCFVPQMFSVLKKQMAAFKTELPT
jgi:hypothetical protein